MNSIRIAEDIALVFDANGHPVVKAGRVPAEDIETTLARWLENEPAQSERYYWVKSWQEAWTQSRPRPPKPQPTISLPAGRDFYFVKGTSRCHRERQLLVRSRTTFVSKNCMACGDGDYVRRVEIPEIPCPHCQAPLGVTTVHQTGYVCFCDQCERSGPLAFLLPWWSEFFQYRGLAAYGDGSFV